MTDSEINSCVSIITVTYNSSDQIEKFLSKAAICVSKNIKIYVADNASSDSLLTKEICDKFGAIFVGMDKNYGYGGAINNVVSLIDDDTEILLISNPDTYLDCSSINLMSQVALENQTGVVGPRILNVNGEIYPSARSFPNLSNGIGHALLSKIWKNNPWTTQYFSDTHLSSSRKQTDWVSGSCIAIKKSLFLELSGFDPIFFMYFEDVDLCFRAKEKGFQNVFLPEASVTHVGAMSTQKAELEMLKIHHESAQKYFDRTHKGPINFFTRKLVKTGLKLRLYFFSKSKKSQKNSNHV